MTEIVVFPDVEAALVAALKPVLGVPVVTKVPPTRPASFVRLTRVGGARLNRITDRPLVVFECWAATEDDASALARLTRAHVEALAQSFAGEAWVRAVVEVSGPQSFPDPVSGTPRYQYTAQLDTRGEALP